MDFFKNEDLEHWLKQQETIIASVYQFEHLVNIAQVPLINPALLDSLAATPPTMKPALLDSLAATAQLAENITSSYDIVSSLSGAYANVATNNLTELQQLLSSATTWLQQLEPTISSVQWQLLVQETSFIEQMQQQIAALGQITIALPDYLLQSWQSTTTMLQFLREYQQVQLPMYTEEIVRADTVSVGMSVLSPTLTATALMTTTSSLVEEYLVTETSGTAHVRENPSSYRSASEGQDIQKVVATHLSSIGSRFVEKWNGAWEVMVLGGSDHQAQATHSARELLMQLLEELAPSTVFPPGSAPTRKMRVKYIMGKNKGHPVDFVNHCANSIEELHNVLCGEAHRRDDHLHSDMTIISYLYSVGALILTLLTYRQRDEPEGL